MHPCATLKKSACIPPQLEIYDFNNRKDYCKEREDALSVPRRVLREIVPLAISFVRALDICQILVV